MPLRALPNDPLDSLSQGSHLGSHLGGFAGVVLGFPRPFYSKANNLMGKKDGKRNDNVRRSWMNQAIVSFYTLVGFLSVP